MYHISNVPTQPLVHAGSVCGASRVSVDKFGSQMMSKYSHAHSHHNTHTHAHTWACTCENVLYCTYMLHYNYTCICICTLYTHTYTVYQLDSQHGAHGIVGGATSSLPAKYYEMQTKKIFQMELSPVQTICRQKRKRRRGRDAVTGLVGLCSDSRGKTGWAQKWLLLYWKGSGERVFYMATLWSIKHRMSKQGLHYTHFLWARGREEMCNKTKTLSWVGGKGNEGKEFDPKPPVCVWDRKCLILLTAWTLDGKNDHNVYICKHD